MCWVIAGTFVLSMDFLQMPVMDLTVRSAAGDALFHSVFSEITDTSNILESMFIHCFHYTKMVACVAAVLAMHEALAKACDIIALAESAGHLASSHTRRRGQGALLSKLLSSR